MERRRRRRFVGTEMNGYLLGLAGRSVSSEQLSLYLSVRRSGQAILVRGWLIYRN